MGEMKLTKDEITALPREERRRYLAEGGDWSDGARAVAQAPRPRPASLPVDEVDPDGVPMKVISVRLPVPMVEALDALAGRDREGRSGIIRDSVAEHFERLREAS